MKIFLAIALIVVLFSESSAQKRDSTNLLEKFPIGEHFLEQNFSPNNRNSTTIDTLLDGVQRYFPDNFVYSLGLSNRLLLYKPSAKIGFRDGFSNLNLFGYNRAHVKYYKTRAPYTEVNALFGMKKEQFSRLLHTQNISKQWNIALAMLRIRSEGFYQRQNCTDNNIAFSSNYRSKSSRYSMLANATVSSIKSDENGGIKYDTAFESGNIDNKKLLSVNLMDARTKRRNREMFLKQSLHFGKTEKITKGDTLISKYIIPTNTISFFAQTFDSYFAYSEGKLDSNYYENNFFDTTQTRDSTHAEGYAYGFEFETKLFNAIGIQSGWEQKSTSRLVQYNSDSSRVLDTIFSDRYVRIELGSLRSKKQNSGIFWSIGKNYIYQGSNEGDDYIYTSLGYKFKKEKNIGINYSSSYRSPTFLHSQYNSNHFIWVNSFSKISENTITGKFIDKKNKYSLGISSSQITGYIYFDTTFSPVQFDSTITIVSFHAQKNLHLKHLKFNNAITWQDVSADVIRVPQFVTNHSIYYEGKWFKKAVAVQIGFDVTYYSSYFGDAYMPALGQYYIQNKKELGDYPFVDFFFNMKIKHAQVFFKSEHVNAGFTGYNYFLAPHMPGPDRSIKVGIKWIFFD